MTGQQSLQTKYRPTTLDEVVGQTHIKDTFSGMLAEGQQRAFIIDGPSGTGKTTLARIAASQLGCSDVEEIDAASNSGIDAMREVARRGDYMTLEGGGRAFIVDECHRLSKAAWDSLLKDIEEPPAGVVWFFCTTEENKVPKTIKTRCVQLTLKEVAYRPLLGLLVAVASKEGIDVPDDVLETAASEADGSPRQALVNLATVKLCKNEGEAMAALNRAPGSKEAIDLARLIIKPSYDFAAAMKVCKDLKGENPESIRHTVRAYATTVLLGSPNDRWARGILLEFEKPAIEHNQISDIICRLITLEKWKGKMNG